MSTPTSYVHGSNSFCLFCFGQCSRRFEDRLSARRGDRWSVWLCELLPLFDVHQILQGIGCRIACFSITLPSSNHRPVRWRKDEMICNENETKFRDYSLSEFNDAVAPSIKKPVLRHEDPHVQHVCNDLRFLAFIMYRFLDWIFRASECLSCQEKKRNWLAWWYQRLVEASRITVS